MSDRSEVMRISPTPGAGVPVVLPASGTRRIDWGGLIMLSVLALAVVFALFTVVLTLRGTEYGFDFRGLWRSGAALLAGHPLYPVATTHALQYPGNALIAPPLLAVLAAPFSLLPLGAAVAVWNLLCLGSLIGGLRLLGVRDGRVLVLAACSFPAVSSIVLGQPEGLFVLAGAVAWHRRDGDAGALAVGVLIAAKLLAWPLVLWLLVTRRYRGALVAAGSAVALLLVSWWLDGFQGLARYLGLLGRDSAVFAGRSHSLVALALHLGSARPAATAVLAAGTLAASAAILRAGRGSDHAWFGAMLLAGLLASPVLWAHYLLVLTVPLAAARRRPDVLWLAFATAFWVSPTEQGDTLQVAAVLALAVVIVAAAVAPRRSQAGAEPV